MKLFRHATETLDDVSSASGRVIETAEWATVALAAIAACAVVALMVGVAALGRADA